MLREVRVDVTLKESSFQIAERGKDRLESVRAKAIRKSVSSEADKPPTLSRIVSVADYAAVGDVHVVIEAVFEVYTVKSRPTAAYRFRRCSMNRMTNGVCRVPT